MPLPAPAEREHLHTRLLDFRGYRRADGLFDVEGRLTDAKTYSFPNEFRGEIRAGEPLHDMWLRVTIDENFIVRDIEAVTDAGPYRVCPAITPNFKKMIGVRMGAGWRRAVNERLGGVEGCTHLVETLGAMATVAFQTLYPYLAKKRKGRPRMGRPPLLDECHVFRSDGDLVRKLWPEHYTGPQDQDLEGARKRRARGDAS
ncbi:MAG: DUF2889 domain-containing protein [Kiloniellaceae bacterium]